MDGLFITNITDCDCKNTSLFECSLCNCQFENSQIHINLDSHKINMEDFKQNQYNLFITPSNNLYCCNLCNIRTSNHESHIRSQGHMMNLQSFLSFVEKRQE